MGKRAPLPPSDQRFAKCSGAIEITRKLIERYPEKFGELVTAQVLFLTKVGGIILQGSQKAGKMEKITGQKKYLSRSSENNEEGWDFVMTLSAEVWDQATDEIKERIVFHELKHAMKDEKDDGNTVWKIVPHDIETFIDETEIYGSGRDIIDLLLSIAAEKED